MTEKVSVLEKAQRLQREAHRLDLSRASAQETQRVQQRLHSLRSAVGELRSLATTARFLGERTGISIDLSMLNHGHKELSKHASGSVPSNNAFVAAERRVKSTVEALTIALQEQWRNWAEEQIAGLEINRIAMLNRTEQDQADAALKKLRVAMAAAPNIATITEFINQYALLTEELGKAPEAPIELLSLLERLNNGGVTLADITDEEIRLLRIHTMDRQIELKRKLS